MANQIIKQPNGKYCIFSSIVDNVTFYNMTEQDIINERVKEAKEKIENDVKETISKLNNGEKPYYQFTLSFDDMIKEISDIHGKREANKIKSLIL